MNQFKACMVITSCLVALALLATPSVAAQAPSGGADFNQWEPVTTVKAKRTDAPDNPDTLVLRNGTRFNTGLFNVRFLGILPTTHRAPYLVLKGVGCTDCDGVFAIYVQSPTDGPVRYPTEVAYAYPGLEYPGPGGEPADTTPTARSRAFIGECLDNMTVGVIWFAAVRDSLGWHSIVHVIDLVSDRIRVRDLAPPLPQVRAVLPFIRASKCHELVP